jgi:drug/metabolite transporter (DMT)-like permease
MKKAMRSTMTFRRYLVLAAVMLSASLGDTFLGRGMKDFGPVSIHHLGSLVHAVANPWVISGILLLLCFFASYLTALSWADLTFVLPSTAFGYVVVALLSKFWLHEHISPYRWAGILLIVLGVGFVTQGPSYTDHSPAESPALSDAEEVGRP